MNYKQKRARLVLLIILIALSIFFLVQQTSNKQEPSNVSNLAPIKLKSKNSLVYNMSSGSIIRDQKSNTKIYPASLTKMMTVLVAIEQIDSLNDMVTISHKDLEDVFSSDASTAGFAAGDQVCYRDLLYAAMLPSGKDATNALSNNISGSEENFAKLLNHKAKELKMNDTNYINSSGVHNENHYTTLNDLKRLVDYALTNGEFKKIVTGKNHTIPRTLSDSLLLKSTLFDNLTNTNINNFNIIGGKTGYTEEAGQCLVTIAKKNNEIYITITANATRKNANETNHINDAITIYNSMDN